MSEDRTNERGQDYSGFRGVTTMKTIDLEQVDVRITEFLLGQRHEEPILLTKGLDAVGLVLKLPEGMKGLEVDGVFWFEGPAGVTHVFIQAKYSSEYGAESKPRTQCSGAVREC